MGFIYKADTYCDACGERVRRSLRDEGEVPKDAMDHNSYDSDDFPKDADIEHEESDKPEHCTQCGIFLHNPLTSDGYAYVFEAINTRPLILRIGDVPRPDIISPQWLKDWANWYNFRYFDAEDIEDAMNPDKYPFIGWYSDEAF